eukprot:TRINITY_DN31657_c0_g1_i1.p1 TRINITY_DN31657_c0_g1~~TRINITY_DN31657_c0_g1_i1.p1  ORF type:complete len:459 (-),score=36.34 TRINITY_DN31657_c0_g1_i1:70-1386(-)
MGNESSSAGQPSVEASSRDRRVLILGSSVSTGEGATPKSMGWTGLMFRAIRPYGFSMTNRGVCGTHVNFWRKKCDFPDLADFGYVFMCLSLGNEGLKRTKAIPEIKKIESHYLDGLHAILVSIRENMHADAKLIVGGPYPNSDYIDLHLQVLRRVHNRISSWEFVDHVIDFLQPVLHDGEGHWHKGASRDAGHPNNIGHSQMFRCLDLHRIFGHDLSNAAMASGGSSASHKGSRMYRYVGKREGTMVDAAVGWFENIASDMTWKSFAGQTEDPTSWKPMNTWSNISLKDNSILFQDGSLGAAVEVDSSGNFSAVTWGVQRWEPFEADTWPTKTCCVGHGDTAFKYYFCGERIGNMKNAAVGWFERSGCTLTWRSFNGQQDDPVSWTPRHTWPDLFFDGFRVLSSGGKEKGALECNSAGVVVCVKWGERRWELRRSSAL